MFSVPFVPLSLLSFAEGRSGSRPTCCHCAAGQNHSSKSSIGITPFRSVLKETEHAGTPLHATLIYANRDTHVPYKKELELMAKRNPHLLIHYLFSPERPDKRTITKLVPDLKKPLFYVSGPEPVVDTLGKMLQEIGVRKTQIKQDWFPGYRAE